MLSGAKRVLEQETVEFSQVLLRRMQMSSSSTSISGGVITCVHYERTFSCGHLNVDKILECSFLSECRDSGEHCYLSVLVSIGTDISCIFREQQGIMRWLAFYCSQMIETTEVRVEKRSCRIYIITYV